MKFLVNGLNEEKLYSDHYTRLQTYMDGNEGALLTLSGHARQNVNRKGENHFYQRSKRTALNPLQMWGQHMKRLQNFNNAFQHVHNRKVIN